MKKALSEKSRRRKYFTLAPPEKRRYGLTEDEYHFKSQHDVLFVESDLKGTDPHLRSRTVKSIEEAVQKAELTAELERFLRAYEDWQRELPGGGLSSHLKNLMSARTSCGYGIPEKDKKETYLSDKIDKNQRLIHAWKQKCLAKGLDVNNFIWLVASPVTTSDLIKRQGKSRLFIFQNLIDCLEVFGEIVKYRLY